MASPLTAAIAEELDLPDGYTLEWTAIDAGGTLVPGVVVNSVSIFGTMLGSGTGGGGGSITTGPYMLVPGPSA